MVGQNEENIDFKSRRSEDDPFGNIELLEMCVFSGVFGLFFSLSSSTAAKNIDVLKNHMNPRRRQCCVKL